VNLLQECDLPRAERLGQGVGRRRAVGGDEVHVQRLPRGDEMANPRQAVERALPLFEFFSFGDETTSVVADCRMRYSGSPFASYLPPGFLRCAGGPSFCLRRTKAMRGWLGRRDSADSGAQGLAFSAARPASPRPADRAGNSRTAFL
jgi:hypothetical protein